ncbi:hypothetical protein D3C73_1177920 [compost metagenome]
MQRINHCIVGVTEFKPARILIKSKGFKTIIAKHIADASPSYSLGNNMLGSFGVYCQNTTAMDRKQPFVSAANN